MFGSGFTTLRISNEEINIIKTVKCLEESGLLIKGSKQLKMKEKYKKEDLTKCY